MRFVIKKVVEGSFSPQYVFSSASHHLIHASYTLIISAEVYDRSDLTLSKCCSPFGALPLM
jgi:hypothetical protein